MDSYNQLNEILVHLFNHTMKIEEESLIKDEFKDISINDMHIIEAVGDGEPKNMSSIARLVGVTVGTSPLYFCGVSESRLSKSRRSPA